jgi:hypothetical protein
MAILQRIPVEPGVLEAFCMRWKIAKLEEFTEDYVVDADLHLLVTPAQNANWSLFDFVNIEDELSVLLGRSVDLVSRGAVEGQERHQRLLASARPFYGG